MCLAPNFRSAGLPHENIPANDNFFAVIFPGELASQTDAKSQTTTLVINNQSYVYQTTYDSDGRVANVTYPSELTTNYVYTSLSYLSEIVDNNTGSAIWTANTRDAELHLTQQTAGNGVVTNQAFNPETGLIETIQAGTSNAVANFSYGFDPVGNLLSRSDANESVSEVYCYDTLNRLQDSATGTSGTVPSTCTSSGTNIIDKTIGYDALGDISSKSDVGTYNYGSGAGPHAVTSVTGSYLGLTNPILAYDANGNMTCVSTASSCGGTVARQITYTSFNMTASLTQGSTSISFTYDSEHARIVQTASAGTTTYANDPTSGGMEEVYVASGTTSWRDYIKADGQIVALRTAGVAGTPTNWGSGTWGGFTWSGPSPTGTYLYFTLDHLGSIAVVTNASGTVVERDSYDAWGKRRNANGTDVSTCSITSATTRGFTNQEMMDAVCLVNLNARLYDPTLGRFLAADPVVGTPFVPQELNRYTYVLNDPLSLTDPTGLCFLGCFWNQSWFGWVRDIVAIAVAIVLQQYEVLPELGAEFGFYASADVAAAVNAGIIGGISGAIATGTLKGAGLGMLQGVLFAEAGSLVGGSPGANASAGSVVAHDAEGFVASGLVGGLVSETGGGNFTSGFLAGGVGSLGGTIFNGGQFNPLNAAGNAVLGGFASVLGGGKFANGAITAAFAYAVETCAEGGCSEQGPTLMAANQDLSEGDVGPGANAITAPNGTYVVVAHGYWYSVAIGGPDGPTLDADQLAETIESDPSYSPHEDILLISCNTGAVPPTGGVAFAQELANDLQSNVTAPNNDIWLNSDGTYVVAPVANPNDPVQQWHPNMNNQGQMVKFSPQPSPPHPSGQ